MAANAPAITLTFLFADLEQSIGEEAPTRENSDAVLHGAIDGHGGWLVEHAGEGVLGAFSSARGAVDAAVELQRAMGLPLRIGVATGDLAPTLNRASRLADAGYAGQVLVAGSTAALLDDIDLLDLGDQRFRDLSMPQRVYQVRAVGLRDSFPPLRTLTSVPGNLPVQLTSLVGREEEMAELIEALGKHRLVTLTGPGGVGKTRLALHAAAKMATDYRGGAWVVELAPVTDPAATEHAIAATLGIQQQPGRTMGESVVDALVFRELLLVLDNCEHLIEEVARLAGGIVARCPGVTLVATSRETLMIPGEQTWPVPSLSIRDGVNSPAVTLFGERAESIVPSFDVTTDAEAVSEICRQLDGIPLAIELAAARVRSLSPAQIRDRLDERFRLLTGGSRGDLERHRTLRNAVEWSYDLLDEPEKRLLARLSVFAGGFSLEAAEQVCADDPAALLLIVDLLDSLVRKSLVTTERAEGEVRYGLLETIRQFGEEKIGADGDADAIRNRHARFFARAARANFRVFTSQSHLDGFNWFEIEYANLRVAFRRSLDRNDAATAATIALEAGFLGALRMNFEPVSWAIESLDAVRAARIPDLGELLSVASYCQSVGRLEESIRFAEEAIRLVEHAGQSVRFTTAWSNGGYAEYLSGRPERGLAMLRAGAARDEEQECLFSTSLLTIFIGLTEGPDAAIALADVLLPRARALKMPLGRPMALEACAWAYGVRDVDVAIDLLEESLTVARTQGIKMMESVASRDLAVQLGRSRDSRRALATMACALGSFQAAGDWSFSRDALGQTLLMMAQVERWETVAILSAVLNASMIDDTAGFLGLHEALARCHQSLGDARFDRFAAKGAAMQFGELVTYAREQISLALADLPAERSDAGGASAAGLSSPPAPSPALPGGLSEREGEVLRLVASGKTNAEIAEVLVISPHTVGRHVSNIFDKLDITHRADAAAWAVRNGLVE